MTAVEYIEAYLKHKGIIIDDKTIPQVLVGVINEAKEMEKRQIVTAFISGDNSDCTQDEDALLYALSYYNETFKK